MSVIVGTINNVSGTPIACKIAFTPLTTAADVMTCGIPTTTQSDGNSGAFSVSLNQGTYNVSLDDQGKVFRIAVPNDNLVYAISALKIAETEVTGVVATSLATALVSGSVKTNTTTADPIVPLLTYTEATYSKALTGSSGRIDVTGGLSPVLDLALSGVTPGTYTKLTIDTFGRATVGATASPGDIGAQPLDSDLTALAALSSNGLAARTGSGAWAVRSVAGASGRVTVADGDGVAGNPTVDLVASGVTPGTYTKITFDTYGRATVGANATTSDIAEGSNLYYTNVRADARIALADLGDLATRLYSDLQGLTNAVTFSHVQQIATARLLGRTTAATGNVEELTASTARTLLNVADGANNYVHPNHTGDVTSVNDGATTIAANAVTLAKMATMDSGYVLGRLSGGIGNVAYLPVAESATGDAIVRRTGGGNINATYLNCTADITATAASHIAVQIGSDSFIRWRTPSDLRSDIGAAASSHTHSAADITSGTLDAARMPALTGDVTTSSGAVATTIANDAVTFAKMQNIATARFLGRNTAATGDVEELTAATARGMLFTGTPDGTKFAKDDGTFAVPSGGATNSSGVTTGAGTDYALTASFAELAFGTTRARATLPTAGTYLVIAVVAISNGGTAGAADIYLYNSTTATDLNPSQSVKFAASYVGQIVSMALVTTTAASEVVQIWGYGTTNTAISTRTSISYVKLT